MGLLRGFVRHGTAANLLMVLVVFAGLAAASGIRKQYMPDVVSEEIEVSVAWETASTEDVNGALVAAIAPALLSVEGLATLEAVAREGSARFTLVFEPGWDLSRGMEDVAAAMPATSSLPDGVEEPLIRRGAWRDRVFDLVLSGDLPRARIEELGRELTQELQRAGLTRVSLRGETAPELSVVIDDAALARFGLGLTDVATAIETAARPVAAGEAGAAGVSVRVGETRLDEAALRPRVLQSVEGPVRLDEVARFETDPAGSGRVYFLEGRPAVSIAVERGAGGDALAIRDTVQQIADRFVNDKPGDLRVDTMRDRAAEIDARLGILIDNAVMGLALVMVLLFLFLSPSAALWVAGGIPVALAAGVAGMWAAGMSLDMVSIFALIICLGIIVDDAIVVAEHAEYRHRTLAEPRDRAAERAARRMVGPVLAATATTVVAFLSLHFIGGRFGAFLATIPAVVAVVLAASLAECFLVLPHHMAHGLRGLDDGPLTAPSRWVNAGFDRLRLGLFRRAVGWVLAARYAVVLSAVALTLQAALMVVERDVAWRFFASPQEPTVSANIAMRDEAVRADTEAMLAELQRAADIVRADFTTRYGSDPVRTILTEIGGSSGRGLALGEDKDEDLLASLTVELIDADARPYDTDAFVKALEAAFEVPPLLETFSFRAGRSGPGEDGLDIALFGDSPAQLRTAAAALMAELSAIPDLTGLETDAVATAEDRVLQLNGLGSAMGFSEGEVASEVRARLGGVTAVSYQQDGRAAEIRVRLPEGTVTSAFLDEIRLQNAAGRWATLSEIVDLDTAPAPRTLRSEAGQIIARVTGEVSTEDAADAETLLARIEADILPGIAATHGIGFEMRGLAAQEDAFLSDALLGAGACVLLIYMALTLVLGHWGWPLAIMSVIPAGLIGVIWGHYAWGLPLSIFSVVGLIGMSGIIVNDSIVLVTAVQERLRRQAFREAVTDAVADRLRPVLLTTLTTVLGLAPLLFERSTQAEFLKPMALTLSFGLAAGFFIVLLLVPSVLMVLRDIACLKVMRRSPAERPDLG